MRIKRWKGFIYNEFRDCWLRWHDYISIMVHNFPILLIRRYDWLDVRESTYIVIFCGFNLLQRRYHFKFK